MFRITRKADYAVFILSTLARRDASPAGDGGAGHPGSAGAEDELVSAQELSAFSSLNKSLVANLLKDLTRAGFLTSVRGARGGYKLARPADEIDLASILEAVEGPFNFVECAEHHAPPAGDDRPAADAPPQQDARAGGGEDVVADLGADAAAAGAECCDLLSLCSSQGALLLLHRRIRGLLQEITLTELSGLDETRARDRAQAMFPSRSASGRSTSAGEASRASG